MEHFHIIQALCRAALAQPSDSIKQQVVRLRDALQEEGQNKNAKALSNLLAASERSIEMAPSRVGRSKAVFKGEELTHNTPLPVNKETSTPIAEIKFIDDLPLTPPIFTKAVTRAIDTILEEWRNLEKIAAVDIEPVRSCLIYGAPGTGKTQLALWMARQLKLPVVVARLDGLVSSFLGTTSRNIGTLFNFADRYRCLLLLDEFDAIAKFRADPQEVGEIKRVVNTLLQNMDARKNHGFTIGVTNHENLLDPAVWRRFDIQVEIPRPSLDVMNQIIQRQLPPVELKDAQIKLLSWLLEGGTGADVETLTRWVKKSFAVSNDFQHEFLSAAQQFIFLNGGRVAPEKRQFLMGERDVLFLELKQRLDMTVSDLADLSGQNKSTVSRIIGRKKNDEVAIDA
ncbi:MAG: ATP-binding protein [Alphaproteobacteria bacterium]|nr:ATP-binding protein [Alphaproteobacteria bacterium]